MEQFYITIITTLIWWILTFLVTFFTTRQSFKNEVLKLKYDYDKILIQERLKNYPELLEITQEIWKSNYSIEKNINIIKEAFSRIKEWRHKWNGYLLLTNKSYRAFNDLKEAISKKPLNPKKWYSKEQLNKIYKLRNNLRLALKEDIWIKIN